MFVLGLLLIVADRWMLLKTVTAFTLAHSITLALATLGYANLPLLPLNAAIALVDPVPRSRDRPRLARRDELHDPPSLGGGVRVRPAARLRLRERRSRDAGLPRSDLPLALVSFNVGVEIGQLGFVALILALERSFRVLEVRWPRWVEALPGYAVGSLGAFWTIQRVALMLRGGDARSVLLSRRTAVAARPHALAHVREASRASSPASRIRSRGSTTCWRWSRSGCGARSSARRRSGCCPSRSRW